MGASASSAVSVVDNKSIANVIMQSITTNSSSVGASTTTNQVINLNLNNSTGATVSQSADITQTLKGVIQNSSDSQLQSAASTALTALAQQQATSSSSIGINVSSTLSKTTQTAITNVSQLITVNNVSTCYSTVAAEQILNGTAVGSTNLNIKQGITISNIADCLLGNSAINSAISQLSTALSATTTQTASSSLIDTTAAKYIAVIVVFLLVLSSGGYAISKSRGTSEFRSVGNIARRFPSSSVSAGGRIRRFNDLLARTTRSHRMLPYHLSR